MTQMNLQMLPNCFSNFKIAHRTLSGSLHSNSSQFQDFNCSLSCLLQCCSSAATFGYIPTTEYHIESAWLYTSIRHSLPRLNCFKSFPFDESAKSLQKLARPQCANSVDFFPLSLFVCLSIPCQSVIYFGNCTHAFGKTSNRVQRAFGIPFAWRVQRVRFDFQLFHSLLSPSCDRRWTLMTFWQIFIWTSDGPALIEKFTETVRTQFTISTLFRVPNFC